MKRVLRLATRGQRGAGVRVERSRIRLGKAKRAQLFRTEGGKSKTPLPEIWLGSNLEDEGGYQKRLNK